MKDPQVQRDQRQKTSILTLAFKLINLFLNFNLILPAVFYQNCFKHFSLYLRLNFSQSYALWESISQNFKKVSELHS